MHNNAFFIVHMLKRKISLSEYSNLKRHTRNYALQLCLPASQQSAETLELKFILLHLRASLIPRQFIFSAFSTSCGHEFYNLCVVRKYFLLLGLSLLSNNTLYDLLSMCCLCNFCLAKNWLYRPLLYFSLLIAWRVLLYLVSLPQKSYSIIWFLLPFSVLFHLYSIIFVIVGPKMHIESKKWVCHWFLQWHSNFCSALLFILILTIQMMLFALVTISRHWADIFQGHSQWV